jgi:hypothetical protein
VILEDRCCGRFPKRRFSDLNLKNVIVSAAGEYGMSYSESYQCDVCGDKKAKVEIGGLHGWTAFRARSLRKINH